jgi:hypothetical protein
VVEVQKVQIEALDESTEAIEVKKEAPPQEQLFIKRENPSSKTVVEAKQEEAKLQPIWLPGQDLSSARPGQPKKSNRPSEYRQYPEKIAQSININETI